MPEHPPLSTDAPDRFNLRRFVEAQDSIYEQALSELRAGRKMSHWMWFIFPQISGLGSSSMAQRYAISGREEALAYLAHPILGARLRESTEAVNSAPPGATLDSIFGYPDTLKFHSSMTLFDAVAPPENPFRKALDRFVEGQRDRLTVARLR